MNHEFNSKRPLIRLAFVVAALSATVSVGGFIDYLATSYGDLADSKRHSVQTAERKP